MEAEPSQKIRQKGGEKKKLNNRQTLLWPHYHKHKYLEVHQEALVLGWNTVAHKGLVLIPNTK